MRINQAQLESLVGIINSMTKSPAEPYSKTKKGFKANVGNYHLSGAYGGVSLHRMDNKSGGVEDVFRCGHTTKKDLFYRMKAFIDGLESK